MELQEGLTFFPGDPQFTVKAVCTIGQHSYFGLSALSMSNHTGTHIDFPSHVLPGAKNSSDFTLDQLRGKGVVVDVQDAKSITLKLIQDHS